MSNAKRRHRRRWRAAIAAHKRAWSDYRWEQSGGIDGLLSVYFGDGSELMEMQRKFETQFAIRWDRGLERARERRAREDAACDALRTPLDPVYNFSPRPIQTSPRSPQSPAPVQAMSPKTFYRVQSGCWWGWPTVAEPPSTPSPSDPPDD